jgi:hypothetical protein
MDISSSCWEYHVSLASQRPNYAMELTASRRTVQLSMSSTRQSAATRAPLAALILFSLDAAHCILQIVASDYFCCRT